MNAIMKYALARAKENEQRKAKPKAEVDSNGVDLSILSNGGITNFNKIEIYVHTEDMSRIIPKGKWHFRDAVGNRIFIKTFNREKAQAFVNEYYGKNKYVVSSSCTD